MLPSLTLSLTVCASKQLVGLQRCRDREALPQQEKAALELLPMESDAEAARAQAMNIEMKILAVNAKTLIFCT